MSALTWFISLFHADLRVGSAVKTPAGRGIISNATVCVDLDHGNPLRPSEKSPRVNVSYPLDKISL